MRVAASSAHLVHRETSAARVASSGARSKAGTTGASVGSPNNVAATGGGLIGRSVRVGVGGGESLGGDAATGTGGIAIRGDAADCATATGDATTIGRDRAADTAGRGPAAGKEAIGRLSIPARPSDSSRCRISRIRPRTSSCASMRSVILPRAAFDRSRFRRRRLSRFDPDHNRKNRSFLGSRLAESGQGCKTRRSGVGSLRNDDEAQRLQDARS